MINNDFNFIRELEIVLDRCRRTSLNRDGLIKTIDAQIKESDFAAKKELFKLRLLSYISQRFFVSKTNGSLSDGLMGPSDQLICIPDVVDFSFFNLTSCGIDTENPSFYIIHVVPVERKTVQEILITVLSKSILMNNTLFLNRVFSANTKFTNAYQCFLNSNILEHSEYLCAIDDMSSYHALLADALFLLTREDLDDSYLQLETKLGIFFSKSIFSLPTVLQSEYQEFTKLCDEFVGLLQKKVHCFLLLFNLAETATFYSVKCLVENFININTLSIGDK